jgi:hypothetical protein
MTVEILILAVQGLFYRLVIYTLPLDIQFSRGVGIPLASLTRHMCVPYPSQDQNFRRHAFFFFRM